ncbi:MAG TPA: DUF6766 family protein [Cytophagaceae bacterium]|jgi:hypothetical protein
MSGKQHSFFYRNGLSIVVFILFLLTLAGQIGTGLQEFNEENLKNHESQVTLLAYLTTNHFVEATFENWESEFLQIGMYVWLTIFLRQKGSAESKDLEEKEDVDREPVNHPNAPWPVKKGGIWVKLYSHSLTLTILLLFILSFILHFAGSRSEYNHDQQLEGKPMESVWEYLSNTKFWFESFQNWQSEFLSVLAIVILSIFLRQKGSPESKPVDAPNSQTGK